MISLKYFSLYVVVLIVVGYRSNYVCGAGANCSSYRKGDNLWKPRCTDDDYWEAVQCKGEKLNGRCFCYSAEGSRIYGSEWWRSAENMTCACSRWRETLEKAGRTDISLHCTSEGNYEELQCDSGLCWCVEPKSGKPTQRVYPESMMTYLPCYNATLVGSQYLRQCESKMVARARVLKKLATHGRHYAHIDAVNCEGDGSYGHYRLAGTQIYCTSKDNKQISTYQTELSNILVTNCNCARDIGIFGEANVEFTLTCDGGGNYAPTQNSNGYPFCVDSDGFATTNFGSIGQDLECWK
ncbi:uncharacterized protein LOC105687303 [Athalia rosae]|uniref:uncharacterized protein LOC105687303 n=1 Tax=Athalia rosae TaxID=37344 RepID=UPI002034370D|nr:uncharacterized protein LOC105687303 [Athalia rosae]